MTVNALNGISLSNNPNWTDATNSLGKEDFLNLLVAQLKSQDPLNPMEGVEFTSQLAQFSSLEQLYNVNTNLETVQYAQAVQVNAQAVDYIGKQVLTGGDSLEVSNGRPVDIHFALGQDAAQVNIKIYDASGNEVAVLERSQFESGEHSLQWDATDDLGQPVADGTYTFQVSAMDEAGEAVEATSRVALWVTGVSFDEGYPLLLAGGRRIALGDVIEVVDGLAADRQ